MLEVVGRLLERGRRRRGDGCVDDDRASPFMRSFTYDGQTHELYASTLRSYVSVMQLLSVHSSSNRQQEFIFIGI